MRGEGAAGGGWDGQSGGGSRGKGNGESAGKARAGRGWNGRDNIKAES